MQTNVTHVGKTADSEENVGIIFPSFVKDVRPPVQELSSSPISFVLVGGSGVECKMAFHCCPRVGQWHCLKSGLRLLLRCAVWVLLAGRGRWQLVEQEAVLGSSQGGAAFVRGNSFRVLPSLLAGAGWQRLAAVAPLGGTEASLQQPQMIEQQPWHSEQRFFFFLGWKMVRIASSKTALRPFWVRAEHSK